MDREHLWTMLTVSAVAAAGAYIFWGPKSQKSPRSRKNKDQVPGLVNLGNTCFLNAVLQALAACPSFVLWLSHLAYKQESKETIDSHLTSEKTPTLFSSLLKTLKVLNNQYATDFNNYSPSEVINSLKAHCWVIPTEEQDAHEMFFVLSSTLDEELSCEPTPSLSIISTFDDDVLSEHELKMNCSRIGLKDQTPTSPFKGLLANQLMCRNCGYKCPVKYDTFDSLSLTIPSAHLGQVTLYNCLQHFVMSEVVSNVECEKCVKMTAKNKHASFFKQLTIGRLPQNLCIHIQRTVWLQNGMPMKRFEHVTYPEYLIMDDFMHRHQSSQSMTSGLLKSLVGGCNAVHNGGNPFADASSSASMAALAAQQALPPLNTTSYLMQRIADGPAIKPIRNMYQLQAVIVHLGDVFSGHFVTYRRGPANSNSWYVTSDTDVKEVPFRDVVAAPAYVLFYEKSNDSGVSSRRSEKAMRH